MIYLTTAEMLTSIGEGLRAARLAENRQLALFAVQLMLRLVARTLEPQPRQHLSVGVHPHVAKAWGRFVFVFEGHLTV